MSTSLDFFLAVLIVTVSLNGIFKDILTTVKNLNSFEKIINFNFNENQSSNLIKECSTSNYLTQTINICPKQNKILIDQNGFILLEFIIYSGLTAIIITYFCYQYSYLSKYITQTKNRLGQIESFNIFNSEIDSAYRELDKSIIPIPFRIFHGIPKFQDGTNIGTNIKFCPDCDGFFAVKISAGVPLVGKLSSSKEFVDFCSDSHLNEYKNILGKDGNFEAVICSDRGIQETEFELINKSNNCSRFKVNKIKQTFGTDFILPSLIVAQPLNERYLVSVDQKSNLRHIQIKKDSVIENQPIASMIPNISLYSGSDQFSDFVISNLINNNLKYISRRSLNSLSSVTIYLNYFT